MKLKNLLYLFKICWSLCYLALTSCFLNASMDKLDINTRSNGNTENIQKTLKIRIVSPMNQNLELTSVQAGELLLIDVVVQDIDGNPVEKEYVKISISGTGNSSSQFEMLTDTLGRNQETFSSTKAELKNLTVHGQFSSYEGPNQILVEHSSAHTLAYIDQPVGGVEPNQVLAQQPKLEIRDAYSNRVSSGPDSQANISLSLFSGNGSLAGTTTLNVTQGLVQFSDIAITAAGSGNVIRATKEDKSAQNGVGSLNVDSNAFTINTTATLSAPTSIYVSAGNKDSNKSPIVEVTGVAGGDTVRLYSDNCVTQIGSVVSSFSTAYITPTSPLSEGTHTFYVRRFNGPDSSVCSATPYTYTVVSLVSISQSTLINRILEGTGLQTVTFELSSIKAYPVTVYYNFDGSTVHANQFTLANGSITIPSGALTANLSLNISSFAGVTGETKILVNIEGTDDDNTKIGTAQSGLIQIKDNESVYVQATKIASGDEHVCAITSANKLFCWGQNFHGQIGQGDLYNTHKIPMAVDASSNYTLVSGASISTCGITSTGVLKCWGRNTSAPTIVDSGITYKSIAAGPDYNCGITTSDQLKCWGDNSYGQLGLNNTTAQPTPVVVNNGTTYKSISVARGGWTTCAITSSDALQCWGFNYYGQVGNGNTSDTLAPVVIDPGTNYKKVSTGYYITCALTVANKLKCWGTGYLGNGAYSSNLSNPTAIDVNTDYSDVSVYSHICGLTMSNLIKCWGDNSEGELGTGNFTEAKSPTALLSAETFTSVTTGNKFTCGLKLNGSVLCWGKNASGQFGYGNAYSNRVPTKVYFTDTVAEISVGESVLCLIDSSQKLKCHSITQPTDSTYLGNGVPSVNKRTPVRVDPLTSYSLISTNAGTSCGITSSGALRCWGANYNGQLGTGTTQLEAQPVTVDSGISYIKVSNAAFHTCGITTSGVLKCWGQNTFGKVGDGTTIDKLFPTIIDSGVTYKEVHAYQNHTCGITSMDELKCWGRNNSGQLGDSSNIDKNVPTPINAGVFYKKISTSDSHTCGITIGNKLKCWGSNTNGRLGDGSGSNQLFPSPVDTSTDFKSVALGSAFGCAITSNDDLKCWGHNFYGQLGDGSSSNSISTPTLIDAGTKYSKISIYGSDTCAKVLTDGSIKCWGYNSKGAIGIKDIFRIYPVNYVTTFKD